MNFNAIRQILSVLVPNPESERKREKVITYITELLKKNYICEVLPYGSVPLKTYLPHGDIDLSIFTQINEENAANGIFNLLKNQNEVQDVTFIRAKVKLVKCIVQDIAVDITFNQVSGLSSLCFLQKADEYIGRDHLLKCSIILVKAWCFYESRILGSSHGLISTYTLDIMVLYIINLFHSSVNSPLAVLDKFLEYYSTFDWANHCIMLNGPVWVKYLPNIVAVTPERRNNMLLKEDFYAKHLTLFSIERELKFGEGAFKVKNLNIIDPLKGSNNLGRSVEKDKFYRIVSALSFGSANLKKILRLGPRDLEGEILMFFKNTVQIQPLIQVPLNRPRNLWFCCLKGDFAKNFGDLVCGFMYNQRTGGYRVEPSYIMCNFLRKLDHYMYRINFYSTSLQACSQREIIELFCCEVGVDEREYFRRRCGPGYLHRG